MSHTVIAEFECNAGKGAGFLEVLKDALSDTRAFEGCELVEIYTDSDNPDCILLFEKWATRENHGAYMAWRGENGMAEMMGPFMSGMPKVTHLNSEPG
jgi:quinol monooxygenase YgiN